MTPSSGVAGPEEAMIQVDVHGLCLLTAELSNGFGAWSHTWYEATGIEAAARILSFAWQYV